MLAASTSFQAKLSMWLFSWFAEKEGISGRR